MRLRYFLLLGISYLLLPGFLHAQWQQDGIPLYGEANCAAKSLVADDDGGVWIAWTYRRGFTPFAWINHFDRDGHKSFGDLGIQLFDPDSLGGYTGQLLGLQKSVDGSVIAAAYGHGLHIYAQRVSPEGELLFGPSGRLVSNSQAWRISEDATWTMPDGDGGLWVIFQHWTGDGAWLAGVNADGSMKFPDEDTLITEDFDRDYVSGLRDRRGLIFTWIQRTDDWEMYATQLDSTGEHIVYPILIFRDVHGIRLGIFPDLVHNGYIFQNSPLYQRTTVDLNPQWEVEGMLARRPYNDMMEDESNPVMLPNGNIAFCGSSWMTPLYSVADTNGVPIWDEAIPLSWAQAVSNNIEQFNFLGLHPDSSSLYTSFMDIGYLDGEQLWNVQVLRFSCEGENVWEDEPNLLFSDNNSRPISAKCVITSDSALVCAVNIHRTNEGRIFKVYQDGVVAGRDEEAIAESDSPLELFRLVSSFPNPFNGTVSLQVDLKLAGKYTWKVYSITGQQIATYSLHAPSSGLYEQTWTPGASAAGGVYLIRWMKDGIPLTTSKVVYLP